MGITYGPWVAATRDPNDLIAPQEIVDYARTWCGTRWRHQGRGFGPRRYIDCAGLMQRTMAHFGMAYQDVFGYTREPGPEFVEQIEKLTLAIPSNAHVLGALAVFSDGAMPCHVGIMSIKDGQQAVVHAESWPKMRTHESPYAHGTPSIKARIVDVRLFRGVDYV